MIVRNEPDGTVLLVTQTAHSRLVGQFAAHWGNARFATPQPYDSVARAAAFHDYGWLRYETAPVFDLKTGLTPNFTSLPADERKLDEYRWCINWLLAGDPYASTIVSMHRTGLWRERYHAIEHPPHPFRPQSAAVDAFIAENEASRTRTIAEHGWDAAQLRITYRLLQVWDLLGLYFACQDPYEQYIVPVPTSYADRDGEGTRMTLTPRGPRTVAFDPFPFDAQPVRVQLAFQRLPAHGVADLEAFRRSYFSAPLELMEFELV